MWLVSCHATAAGVGVVLRSRDVVCGEPAVTRDAKLGKEKPGSENEIRIAIRKESEGKIEGQSTE